MITTAKIKGAFINGTIRFLKFLQFGTKTAINVGPFGDDSVPIEDTIAIYVTTSSAQEDFIIGYINKNALAEPGEKRFFAVDPKTGNEVGFIWLKNDGSLEIMGANHNMVRFAPLDSGLKAQDSQINVELQKISVAITGVGGVYTPGNISTDISVSKIDEIKTL